MRAFDPAPVGFRGVFLAEAGARERGSNENAGPTEVEPASAASVLVAQRT